MPSDPVVGWATDSSGLSVSSNASSKHSGVQWRRVIDGRVCIATYWPARRQEALSLNALSIRPTAQLTTDFAFAAAAFMPSTEPTSG